MIIDNEASNKTNIEKSNDPKYMTLERDKAGKPTE